MSNNFVRGVCALGSFFVATWLGVACGTAPDPVVGGAGGASPACPGVLVLCGTSCVDARFDPVHCGECDTACASGEVCSERSCGLVCTGGTTRCEVPPKSSPNDPPVSVCIDTNVDADHCGACGVACSADQVCSNGSCADDCNGGTTECAGADGAICVNVAKDSAHCGACDAACPPGKACVAATCATVCVGGTTLCKAGSGSGAGGSGGGNGAGGADGADTDICVDTMSTTQHCGGCGKACPVGQVCQGGACLTDCAGGATKCQDANKIDVCVNTEVHPQHCGDCTTACPVGNVCQSGDCVTDCMGGTKKCQDANNIDMCVDTKLDIANCGLCGKICLPNEVCSKGLCALSCVGGTTKCGGKCVDTQLDPGYCGKCEIACLPNEVCSKGLCALTCVGGTTNCGGKCVDTKLDANHCNGCNKQCMAGEVCSAGACSLTCTGGTTKCGGACANTQLDPANCGACGKLCGGNQACVLGTCKPLGPHAVQISTTLEHGCARLSDGSAKCWGYNLYGQLGLGDNFSRGDGPNEMGDLLPALSLGTGKTVKSIAAGDFHSCALLNDGSVKCWGNNFVGQLGVGDQFQRGDQPATMGDALLAVPLGGGETAKAIAAGYAHTCVLLTSGSVKCWGFNNLGQLGLGDTAARGDGPGEMGDSLMPVSLGTGMTAKAIAVGTWHSCAKLADDTVKCWGNNQNGQLGLADINARGDAPGEMGDMLPAISLGSGVTATTFTAGHYNTCAVLGNGSVKCWGYNFHGQLGLGDVAQRGDDPDEMGDKLPAISLGTGVTATAVGIGQFFTCALLSSGSVKCWGNNANGQLGLGNVINRGDDPNEMGDALQTVSLGAGKAVKAITTGSIHTCTLLTDDTVKCWGDNVTGQLGLGDTSRRGDGPGELGDLLPVVMFTGQ
ncbi:MAG: hypothetical protein EXR75_01270 [Myxococcales bacterium]|nr:hypothetical protein [Myxococcales bacterium]